MDIFITDYIQIIYGKMSTGISDQAIAAVAGVRDLNTAANAVQTSTVDLYDVFKKPKTGILSYLYPTDGTWHQLYRHNYEELTNIVIPVKSASAGLDEATQKAWLDAVGDVVAESYTKTPMAWCYWLMIVGTICVLILLVAGQFWAGIGVLIGVTALSGCIWLYAKYVKRADGEELWREYRNSILSQFTVGDNGRTVLELARKKDERAEDRADRAAALRSNSGATSLAAGIALGKFL
jgi:hypothetical protein